MSVKTQVLTIIKERIAKNRLNIAYFDALIFNDPGFKDINKRTEASDRGLYLENLLHEVHQLEEESK